MHICVCLCEAMQGCVHLCTFLRCHARLCMLVQGCACLCKAMCACVRPCVLVHTRVLVQGGTAMRGCACRYEAVEDRRC